MTGVLLTVFLIGAFSSNRSTGLAHVPCLYSIGKPNARFDLLTKRSDHCKASLSGHF